MLVSVNSLKKCALAPAAVAAALTLVACQAATGPDEIAGPGDGQAQNMGNAEPVPSPPAGDPAGEVHPFPKVRDLDASGGLIAVRTDDALTVGPLSEVVDGTAREYSLDPSCGDATARDGQFVVACGATVRIFDASGERGIDVAEPATVAAITSEGEVITGSDAQRSVHVYRDGAQSDSFSVARETDQLLTVPREGQSDAAVRVNHFDTTIQDLDLENGRQGGTLRAGLGVGKVGAGRDGLVLAADNTGSQLLVYTTTDIIRLQQSAPVAASPWAVAWDDEAGLAWVTSTATNTASGYDISQGVPLHRVRVDTVADARSMATLDDGTLVIASATGDGLQVIPPAEKNALKEKTQ